MTNLPTRSEIEQAAAILRQKNILSSLQTYNPSTLLLKTDCTLPGGSYKIRGVEYFASRRSEQGPVQVLSAGNLALAAAIRFKETNTACEALVPQGISQIKRERLEKMGAQVREKPFAEIWEWVHRMDLRQSQQFLHPFNQYLLAGYGSLVPELMQAGFNDGALVVPYGLGGLAMALAHAIEVLNSNIQLYVCEIRGFAPFSRALSAQAVVRGEKLQSFIEAMGTPEVLPDVFAYLRNRIAGVVEVTEAEVREEIRNLAAFGLRVEGAAGASAAAAKKIRDASRVTALLTGANISEDIYHDIIHDI
jgi:threonine dehydratase